MDEGQTQVVTFARHVDFAPDDRVHCLELIDGFDFGRRFVVGVVGVNIGRTEPADIILTDSEVSRAHCRLQLEGEALMVTDLNSTNGTYIDGVRLTAPAALPVGATLRVGRQLLKHEWRTQKEILQHEELDRELKKANSYVLGLLPPPLGEGPIRTEWLYEPCSKLGGDGFGYGPISDTKFLIFMLDVSGHGAGAAMHGVAVMNLLRQKALPGADLTKPDQVLAALNAAFPMEAHAGMYFTMWCGVYDKATRQLDFASAGHHPGFLVPATRGEALALRTRNGPIGTDPPAGFRADKVTVPEGANLYLFSDGVFEIVTKDGVEWGLSDFLPLLPGPPMPGMGECQRLYRGVRGLAQSGSLDDDFTLLVLTFD